VGKTYSEIDEPLAAWIAAQHVFFVATAPRGANGHIHCSPKGGDTLRVLGPRAVAYADGAGSGVETISHVRDNGRMVLMLCAFEGAPRIVRLHGHATVVTPNDATFRELLAQFPPAPTVRAIILLDVQRVSDSCGYGVPLMDFRADRRESQQYVRKSTDKALETYMLKNNQSGIDGLSALTPEEIRHLVINRDERVS
jgi:predicted pyridoxine 5'-phosphate oxidase superfamily flavin-nucleotide-binding protein